MTLLGDVIKEWKFGLGLVVFILFCAYLTLLATTQIAVMNMCYEHGYSTASVLPDFRAYCMKVENGTTVITDAYSLLEKE